MTARNNIHRQQLFHWIGKNIEAERSGSKKLTDPQRERYVTYLRGSVKNGLWMTSPSERIASAAGSFTQKLPAVCFTEWSLDHSLPHTTHYGRLGLGFPKRVVLLKGGQPVSYFKSTGRKRRYADAMIKLMQFFHTQDHGDRTVKERLEDLRYLLSFSRAIRQQVEPAVKRISKRASRPGKPLARAKRAAKLKRTIKMIDPYARKFGLPLDLAEEREWRIVFHADLLKTGTISKGPGTPPYYVPYIPGAELFTVALPDNRTVHRVLQDDQLCRELFGERRPHVTVMSLQDVGTF